MIEHGSDCLDRHAFGIGSERQSHEPSIVLSRRESCKHWTRHYHVKI